MNMLILAATLLAATTTPASASAIYSGSGGTRKLIATAASNANASPTIACVLFDHFIPQSTKAHRTANSAHQVMHDNGISVQRLLSDFPSPWHIVTIHQSRTTIGNANRSIQ